MTIKSNIMIMFVLSMMIISVSAFNPKTTSMMVDEINTPENMKTINNIMENPDTISRFMINDDMREIIKSTEAVHINISDGFVNNHYYFLRGDNRLHTHEDAGVDYLEIRTDSNYVRFAYENQETLRKYLKDEKISTFEMIKLKIKYMKYT